MILVDGKQLARLMIDYGVGVTSPCGYDSKRIDLDYFASDDEATSGPARLTFASSAAVRLTRSGVRQ